MSGSNDAPSEPSDGRYSAYDKGLVSFLQEFQHRQGSPVFPDEDSVEETLILLKAAYNHNVPRLEAFFRKVNENCTERLDSLTFISNEFEKVAKENSISVGLAINVAGYIQKIFRSIHAVSNPGNAKQPNDRGGSSKKSTCGREETQGTCWRERQTGCGLPGGDMGSDGRFLQ
jgi:hypothetical protein